MTSFHRDISGTFDGDQAKEFQGYDETICKRLEDASQKGWVLEGSPIALWDPKEGKIGAFQAISGHGDIPYGTFKPLGEVPPLVKTEQQSRYIRFVAGEDKRPYCALIEGLLQDGWETYGNASFFFNEGAQARWLVRLMTKKVTGDYPGFVDFAEIPSRQKGKSTRQALHEIGVRL